MTARSHTKRNRREKRRQTQRKREALIVKPRVENDDREQYDQAIWKLFHGTKGCS